MKLASLIKSKRKAANLTQQNLADACDVSRITVGYWECGRNEPHPSHFPVIKELIGLDIEAERSDSWLKVFTPAAAAWSNFSERDSLALLAPRLANANFIDLIDLCLLHGAETVDRTLESIRLEMHPMQYTTERGMLDNVIKGMQHV